MSTRRDILKLIGSGIVGLAVGGAAGYFAAPPKVVKETVTITPTREIPSKPIRLGIVQFLTGPAAAAFGIPGKNGYEVMIDYINEHGGIAGRKIQPLYNDESGGVDVQVKLARKLALEDKVDAILGYISSADCKAIAPLADELGIPIIFEDCGTHVLMECEEAPCKIPKYKLAFRTCAHLSIDCVGLAYYLRRYFPEIKSIAGINPDYAWGRDNWKIFTLAMEKLFPDIEIVGEWWPKLFTTDYTAHITGILKAKPDIVFTSFWGGDAVTFIKQAITMGLFKVCRLVGSRGEPYPQEIGPTYPEGSVISCAGPHYFLYPPPDKWPLNKWFVDEYYKRYGKYPTYSSYHAAQNILGYKYAIEKAIAQVGGWPDPDEFAEAMSQLIYEAPSGFIMIREDHNAVEDVLVGVVKKSPEYDFPVIDFETAVVYPAHIVNAPVGTRTEDWIESWRV